MKCFAEVTDTIGTRLVPCQSWSHDATAGLTGFVSLDNNAAIARPAYIALMP